MPIGPSDFLLEIIIPALLALAAMCLAWRPWRRFPQPKAHWGGAVAVALAVLAAYRPVFGAWPSFPPSTANHWLFYVVLLALLVGLLDALIRPPRWIATIGIFIAAMAALAAMLKFALFGEEHGPAQSIGLLLLFGLIGAAWWITFELTADDGGVVAPLLMWITVSTVAVVFMLTDSFVWGKLAMALAAAAGALLVMILWRRSIRLSHGAMHVFAIVMLCLIIPVHYVASLSIGKLVTLLAVPAFIWIGRLITMAGPISRLRPWQRAVIRVAALVIPMAVLLSVAAVEFRRTSGGGGE
jgi:hypothetical protein